jgi:hypothetical protein
MTLIDARLYLPANATILHLETERETDVMTASEIPGREIGDTGVAHPEVTEIRGEAGGMTETEIDGAAEMSGISGIREIAEAVDVLEMIEMER